jgi:hypothetical protein
MMALAMPLGGAVRLMMAANQPCLPRPDLAYRSDGLQHACRMVAQGHDSLQHVPMLRFMKYPG